MKPWPTTPIETTAHCATPNCHGVWRTHTQTNYTNGTTTTQTPCPKCGTTTKIRKIAHDPEKFTIN